MPLYTNHLQASQLPFTVGPEITRPLFDGSVAARTLNIFVTGENSVRFPVITEDPESTVVGEGNEIPPDSIATAEIVSQPVTIAAHLITSRQALGDSNGLADTIALSLARSLGRKLDQCVWNTVTGFKGINQTVGATTIDAGAAFSAVDPFIEGLYAASEWGVDVSAWVMNPQDAKTIALLPDGTDSPRKLLQPTPTENGIIQTIAGVPIVTTGAVEPGRIWGVNDTYVNLVMRQDIDVFADSSVYATSLRVANIGYLRASLAVTLPESLILIETS